MPATRTAPNEIRRNELLLLLGQRYRELLQATLSETVQHYAALLEQQADAPADVASPPARPRAGARLTADRSALVARVLDVLESQARSAFRNAAAAAAAALPSLLDEDDLLDHLAIHRAAAACRPHGAALQRFLQRLSSLNGGTNWSAERAPFSPAALAGAFNQVLLEFGQTRAQRELALGALGRSFAKSAPRVYGVLDELLAAQRVEPAPEPDAATPAGAARGGAVAGDAGTLASLERIGAALAARRRALGTGAAAADGPLLAGVALDKVLYSLQRTPSLQRDAPAVAVRDQIAAYLSAGEAASAQPQFEAPARDTIEFIGLVFEHLLRQGQPAAHYAALIRRLEIPLLRLALADRGVFAQPAHAARRLLNVVGEIALYWLDPQRCDSELHKLTRRAVEQIARQDAMHESLFAAAAERLTQEVERLGERGRLLEARLVGRAVAQEKLEIARRRAATFSAELCAALPVDSAQRAWLESTWKDVLVLTLLRSGAESERWRERTEAARWLVRRDDPDAFTPLQFRRIVELGVHLLGFEVDETEALLERLLARPAAPPVVCDEAPVRPNVACAGTANPAAAALLTAEERHIAEQLRSLPNGCWLEFRRSDGSRERQRLAWFSCVTERYLFVTPDGKRAHYRALSDLTRAIAHNEARVLTVGPSTWFDRAWRTVTEGLRVFLAPDEWDPLRI